MSIDLNNRKSQLGDKLAAIEQEIALNSYSDEGEILRLCLTKSKIKIRIEEIEFLLGNKDKDIYDTNWI